MIYSLNSEKVLIHILEIKSPCSNHYVYLHSSLISQGDLHTLITNHSLMNYSRFGPGENNCNGICLFLISLKKLQGFLVFLVFFCNFLIEFIKKLIGLINMIFFLLFSLIILRFCYLEIKLKK